MHFVVVCSCHYRCLCFVWVGTGVWGQVLGLGAGVRVLVLVLGSSARVRVLGSGCWGQVLGLRCSGQGAGGGRCLGGAALNLTGE